MNACDTKAEQLALHKGVVAMRFTGSTNALSTAPFNKKGLLPWEASNLAICNGARSPFVFRNVPTDTRFWDWEAGTLTGTTRPGGTLHVPSQYDAPWSTRIGMCLSNARTIQQQYGDTFVLCVVDIPDAGELYDGEVAMHDMPSNSLIVFWQDDEMRYVKSETGVYKRVKQESAFPQDIFKSLPPEGQMLVSPRMKTSDEFSDFLEKMMGSHIHPRAGTDRRHEKTVRLPDGMHFAADLLPWYDTNEHATVLSWGQLSRTFKVSVMEGAEEAEWSVTVMLLKTGDGGEACPKALVTDECDAATSRALGFVVDVIKDKYKNPNLVFEMMQHDHSACIKHHPDMKNLLKRVADEARKKWDAVSWAFDGAMRNAAPSRIDVACGKMLGPMRQGSAMP